MTAFILFHTAVGVLPIGFGLAAFARHGTIDPKTRLGKWYIGTMVAGAVSGFGFILTNGFTPGQVLGVFTLALLAIGTLTMRGTWRKPGYTQAIALSASFLMLMVFATTETLKQFPIGKPFASNADDPSLIPVRLALLGMFVIGVTYQVLKIRANNNVLARLDRLLANYSHAA
jgi:hypothetical protein